MATEPLAPADFGRPADVRDMAQAIASVAENLDQAYPLLIAGERVAAEPVLVSSNPSSPSEVVARFPSAAADHVASASAAAARACRPGLPPDPLHEALARAADRLARRRFEFAAWICFEAGLTWTEADTEVCDAVAALRSAAVPASGPHPVRPAVALGPPARVPAQADRDPFRACVGAGLAVTPAVSPLAVPAALVAGVLARGNAVCLRPSGHAPTVAWKLVELLWDAGVPPPRVSLLTTDRAGASRRVLPHPDWRFHLLAGCAEAVRALGGVPAPCPKVVWGGSGGDAAVPSDADPAAAAASLASLAFARAGQGAGPRAVSRAFVAAARFDAVAEAVAARAAALHVGAAIDIDTAVGPLRDAETLARARADREEVRRGSRAAAGAGPAGSAAAGEPVPGGGHFLAPELRLLDAHDAAGDDPWRASPCPHVGPTLLLVRIREADDAFLARARARSGRPVTSLGGPAA